MFCTKCGTQLPDGSAFCTNCGASIAVAPMQPVSQVEQNAQPNPYVAQEPVAQPNPYMAQEPAAQPNPYMGQEPAAQPNPYVAQEPVAQSNPYMAQEPAAQPNPYMGQEPATQPNPYMAQEPVAQPNPYMAQEMNAQANPYGAQDPNAYNSQMNPFTGAPIKKKSKKPLIITLIVVAIIAIAVTVLLILKPWADKDDDKDENEGSTKVASTEKATSGKEEPTTKGVESMDYETASEMAEDVMAYLLTEKYDKLAGKLHPAIVEYCMDTVDNNEELAKRLFYGAYNYHGDVLSYQVTKAKSSKGNVWKDIKSVLIDLDSYSEPLEFVDVKIDFTSDEAEGEATLEIGLCEDGNYYITGFDASEVMLIEDVIDDDEGNMIIYGEDLSDLFTSDDSERDGVYGFGETVYGDGYTYEIPSTWECMDEDSNTYVSANATASMVQLEDATFGNYGVHEYFESLLNQYSIQNVEVTAFSKSYIGGNLAVVTQYQKENDQGIMVYGVQVMYLYDGKLIAFTIGTSDLDSEEWEEAKNIAKSFQIN